MSEKQLEKFIVNLNSFCASWVREENPKSIRTVNRLLDQYNFSSEKLVLSFTIKPIK